MSHQSQIILLCLLLFVSNLLAAIAITPLKLDTPVQSTVDASNGNAFHVFNVTTPTAQSYEFLRVDVTNIQSTSNSASIDFEGTNCDTQSTACRSFVPVNEVHSNFNYYFTVQALSDGKISFTITASLIGNAPTPITVNKVMSDLTTSSDFATYQQFEVKVSQEQTKEQKYRLVAYARLSTGNLNMFVNREYIAGRNSDGQGGFKSASSSIFCFSTDCTSNYSLYYATVIIDNCDFSSGSWYIGISKSFEGPVAKYSLIVEIQKMPQPPEVTSIDSSVVTNTTYFEPGVGLGLTKAMYYPVYQHYTVTFDDLKANEYYAIETEIYDQVGQIVVYLSRPETLAGPNQKPLCMVSAMRCSSDSTLSDYCGRTGQISSCFLSYNKGPLSVGVFASAVASSPNVPSFNSEFSVKFVKKFQSVLPIPAGIKFTSTISNNSSYYSFSLDKAYPYSSLEVTFSSSDLEANVQFSIAKNLFFQGDSSSCPFSYLYLSKNAYRVRNTGSSISVKSSLFNCTSNGLLAEDSSTFYISAFGTNSRIGIEIQVYNTSKRALIMSVPSSDMINSAQNNNGGYVFYSIFARALTGLKYNLTATIFNQQYSQPAPLPPKCNPASSYGYLNIGYAATGLPTCYSNTIMGYSFHDDQEIYHVYNDKDEDYFIAVQLIADQNCDNITLKYALVVNIYYYS